MDEDNLEKKPVKHKIVLLGLVIHVLLLMAVFDVYFASPLDNGMSPVRSTKNPPAKRLVLFVADGLRAQAIFGVENEKLTPFLTKIKYNNGSWGTAHTRVPTESRPGHVAMLAGIYEDPSAILKGWKSNPVNFDSVINQSTNAWAWGSPDIVKIFNRDNLLKIHVHSYDSNIEDFGKKDTGVLDIWVFDKVRNFINNDVLKCTDLCHQYFDQGNIFFLHLLGIDTAGHGYKPYSKEYNENIQLVDKHVKEITELFNYVFNDSVVFVFTADHGMTDWGSHGTGLDHETQTPIIVWGSGIKQNPLKQDINQIDIAPLLASLIGINIPINSLGILPTNYLDVDKNILIEMILSNVKELIEIFYKKMERIRDNSLIYIPFRKLTNELLGLKVKELHSMKSSLSIDKFISESKNFMKILIEGINYYHNYYQYPILISVSLGFIIWITFLCASVLNLKVVRKPYLKLCFILTLLITYLCKLSQFPLSYYLYFNFPLVAYFYLLDGLNLSFIFLNLIKHIWSVAFYLIGVELLVYGFFNRNSFSVLMLLVGFWVYASESLKKNSSNSEKKIWLLCSLVLSIFPSLPVMKTSFNLPIYMAGYLCYFFIFLKLYLFDLKFYERFKNVSFQYKILFIQFGFSQIAALYSSVLIEFEYISPESNLKYFAWAIFLIPLALIPLTDNFIFLRLTSTVLGFAPFYYLVSSNFELLFSAVYVFFLYTWLVIESKTFELKNSFKIIYYLKFADYYDKKHHDNADSFRRAFLFMVFILVGFFGTGTIASMNSFDPMWTRAFLTVFSPFKMMGIILLKFIVPFIFTCSVFRAINEVGRQDVLNIFCIILVFSDLMVLQFLYLITNVGSWLDIGSSLSHFIIMEGFTTVLLLLYAAAQWLSNVRYKYFITN